MQLTGLLLGLLILGQTADGTLPPQPKQPPELVAEWIRLPSDSALGGEPLALQDALKTTNDRREQLEIVRHYWQLATALAEYRFYKEQVELWRQLAGGEEAEKQWRAYHSAAVADLQMAELIVVQRQHELAALLRLPVDKALPLPADKPHLGAYRTNYNELFAGRTPPLGVQLLEKLLPLQRQVIDEGAKALQAAEDALSAALEDHRHGRIGREAVYSAGRERLHARREFIYAVQQYNNSIAEYALTVAAPTAGPQAIAAMLIGPVTQAAAAPRADIPPQQNPPGNSRNEPTLAPPREGWRPSRSGDTSAPPPAAPSPTAPPPTFIEPRREIAPPAGESPEEAPRLPEAEASALPRMVRKIGLPSSAGEGASLAAPLSSEESRASEALGAAAGQALYPALVQTPPAAQAKQLTLALHWDRRLPPGLGKPLTLLECLQRAPTSERADELTSARLTTIAVYWSLKQKAAEYQLLAEQGDLLESLTPVVLSRRHEPSGATDMLRLHAARLALQTEMEKARAALLAEQFNLAVRLGMTSEGEWPLASTIPHSGGYLLKLDIQPATLLALHTVQRLAATIPALGEAVQKRAAATVEADIARVAAAENYRAGKADIDEAIQSILFQTEQSMAFLHSLTAYNQAIAEYALTILPPTVPPDQLVSTLVLKP